jgi:hypothetical protein
VLQLKYNNNSIEYRWNSNISNFNMPVRAGFDGNNEFIYPTSTWQTVPIDPELIMDWKVDSERFYIDIELVE